jgi:hypothetical protein
VWVAIDKVSTPMRLEDGAGEGGNIAERIA